MPITTQLTDDMKSAMKAHDTITLSAVRYVLSVIKNYEIDHGPQNDESLQKIIATQLKQMREACQEFEKGNRADLVQEEQAKIKVLEKYVPKQLSDDELTQVVQTVLAATSDRSMGTLIGAVKQQVAGQADGARIAAAVKAAL